MVAEESEAIFMINRLCETIKQHEMNVYSLALMNEDGIQEVRIHPADLATNSYSVAKAFAMTAIGMLWDKGQIRVEDKVYDIMSEEFPEEFDPRWKEVTVEHVLTHKAGFEHGFLDIDVEDISEYPSDDFLKIVFSEPIVHEPGTEFVYTDAAYYLISRIVTKISGQRLDDFLRPVLFGTMKFQELAWSTCPHGYCMGATGLFIRTKDMVKLGFMYANDGCYFGERVVSEEWVKLVLEREYEFRRQGETGIYAKGGMCGQMLAFWPEQKMACAWHGYEIEKDMRVLFDV